MAQTTAKSVVAKKSATLPKTQKPIAAPKKTAAAKPAKKPATAKDAVKTPAKKAAPRATAAKGNGEIAAPKKTKKTAGMLGGVTPEQRYRMICDAAYYRAERRGFIGGDPAQDWAEAELEIDQLLCGSPSQQPGH